MDSNNSKFAQHIPVVFDWQKLITPGHVWVARFNQYIPVRAWIAFTVFLALFNHDIFSSSKILESRLRDYKKEPAGWFAKIIMSPFNYLHSAVVDSPEDLRRKNPAPELDLSHLQEVFQAALKPYIDAQRADPMALQTTIAGMRAEGGRNEASWRQLVMAEIDAMTKDGKIDANLPMVALGKINQTWYADLAASESPVYKMGKDGVLWVGAVITDKADGKIKPVLGVIRKMKDGKYKYFTVKPSGNFFTLPGSQVIALTDIPRQVAADFPELVAPPKPVAPVTASAPAATADALDPAEHQASDANSQAETNDNTGPTPVRPKKSQESLDFFGKTMK